MSAIPVDRVEAPSLAVRPAKARSQRLSVPELDGLRALAMLIVCVKHVVQATTPSWMSSDIPAINYLLHDSGYLAVSFFFVLSGFLVSQPFVAWARDPEEKPLAIGRYARTRILRVFPAWWVCFLIVAAISSQDTFRHLPSLALFLTLHQNYDPDELRTVVSPAWSLCIDVAFYLALPALFLILRALRPARPLRVALIAVGCFWLITIAFNVWWFAPSNVPHPDLRPLSFSLLSFGGQFSIGLLLAATYRHLERIPRVPLAPIALVLFFLTATFVRGDHPNLARPVFVLCCGLAFAAVLQRRGQARLSMLRTRVLKRCADRSYGIYLWHLPLFHGMEHLGLVERGVLWHTWHALALMIGGAWICAWASATYVELPLRRRFATA